MQHYLLMVKAACLAYEGTFNDDCPYTPARSPFNKEETAQYFVDQFLNLDPDAKLEQAMDAVSELKNQLEAQYKTDKASINISIENLDLGKMS